MSGFSLKLKSTIREKNIKEHGLPCIIFQGQMEKSEKNLMGELLLGFLKLIQVKLVIRTVFVKLPMKNDYKYQNNATLPKYQNKAKSRHLIQYF